MCLADCPASDAFPNRAFAFTLAIHAWVIRRRTEFRISFRTLSLSIVGSFHMALSRCVRSPAVVLDRPPDGGQLKPRGLFRCAPVSKELTEEFPEFS